MSGRGAGEGSVRALAFGEVAAEQAGDDGEAEADDHEEDAGGDLSAHVGEQEDDDSRVHEDGEEDAKGGSGHNHLPGRETHARRTGRVRRGEILLLVLFGAPAVVLGCGLDEGTQVGRLLTGL